MPRPRTPTRLKVIEGRHGAADALAYEPDPGEVERLEPTAELSPEGREVWDREAPILREAGMLSRADLTLMTQYAQAAGLYLLAHRKWRELCRKDGEERLLSKYPNGNVAEHPLLQTMRRWQKESVALGGHLGLSPAARSRLGLSSSEQAKQRAKADLKRRFLRKA